jgi:hypothetical protein
VKAFGLYAIFALAAAAAPAFQMLPPAIQLEAGQKEKKGLTITILAAGLTVDPKKTAGTPVLSDRSFENYPGTNVTAQFLPPAPAPAENQAWQFTISIEHFPSVDSQSRVFLLSYAGLNASIPYTISNMAGKTFAWSVKAPAEWNASSQPNLDISIRNGDLPASGLTLHQASWISEDKAKVTLGKDHVQLCGDPTGTCAPPAQERALRPRPR